MSAYEFNMSFPRNLSALSGLLGYFYPVTGWVDPKKEGAMLEILRSAQWGRSEEDNAHGWELIMKTRKGHASGWTTADMEVEVQDDGYGRWEWSTKPENLKWMDVGATVTRWGGYRWDAWEETYTQVEEGVWERTDYWSKEDEIRDEEDEAWAEAREWEGWDIEVRLMK
jgi:hypothetical protein